MSDLKITQVKSIIDRPRKQKETMKALGLRKVNSSVVKQSSPQILGMIKKVSHLVRVEEA